MGYPRYEDADVFVDVLHLVQQLLLVHFGDLADVRAELLLRDGEDLRPLLLAAQDFVKHAHS